METKKKQYITIDIGGTSIKHGVINEEITFLVKKECETNASLGGPHIMHTIESIIREYQMQYEISGVAISTAGMVDHQKGEIIYASELIPQYTGTKIKQSIQKMFDIPCEVENDVNCAGLSEAMVGAGKGTKSSLCLTIGTGIGGCIIINNQIYHGFSGSACEVGYMHLPGGEFQKLGATTALVEKVAAQKGDSIKKWDGKRIFALAKEGDVICNQAIDEMVDVLGQGIANLCYVFNPEIVILGGGIMAQKEFLEEKIQESLNRFLLPVIRTNTKLEFAKNKNQAGMLGAYFYFISKHS